MAETNVMTKLRINGQETQIDYEKVITNKPFWIKETPGDFILESTTIEFEEVQQEENPK